MVHAYMDIDEAPHNTPHLPTIIHLWTTSRSLENSSCHCNLQKSNKSDPANYRPISLTCILCKVIELLFLSHMWKHLNRNNIILPHQHGFRSGLSCETQLVETVYDWAASMNKCHQTDLILLDFSKPTNDSFTNFTSMESQDLRSIG